MELSDNQIKAILDSHSLSGQQLLTARQGLRECRLYTAAIRKALLKEGEPCAVGVYILKGSVMLLRAARGQQIPVAEIGAGHLANPELPTQHWINKYTLQVATSHCAYVLIPIGIF